MNDKSVRPAPTQQLFCFSLNEGFDVDQSIMNEKGYQEPSKCKSILVIEDEKDIRDALQQALELEGYHTFGAANGKEGTEVLSKIEKPCLILLDLMMPVMNGWQFVEALSEDRMLSGIPVVIVSAFGNTTKAIPAREFIKKPVDLDILFDVVQKYCV